MAFVGHGKTCRGRERGLYCHKLFLDGKISNNFLYRNGNNKSLEVLKICDLSTNEVFVESSIHNHSNFLLAEKMVEARNKLCTAFIGVRFDKETYMRAAKAHGVILDTKDIPDSNVSKPIDFSSNELVELQRRITEACIWQGKQILEVIQHLRILEKCC